MQALAGKLSQTMEHIIMDVCGFTNLDMIDEIWTPINVNVVITQVSNLGHAQHVLGRVQNEMRKTFGTTFGCGYKKANIKGQPFLVHRLVIIAFRGNHDPKDPSGIPGCKPKLIINHIDRDKTNNRLDNLPCAR